MGKLVKIAGKVLHVGERFYGQGKSLSEITVEEQPRRDEFGDPVGQPEVYSITGFKESFSADKMRYLVGQNVKFDCFLNSREYSKDDGSKQYILNLNISKYELPQGSRATQNSSREAYFNAPEKGSAGRASQQGEIYQGKSTSNEFPQWNEETDDLPF